MKPLDPRLLRYARSSRRFLVLGAVLGLVQTLAMIVFAWFVAVAVTGAIAGRTQVTRTDAEVPVVLGEAE